MRRGEALGIPSVILFGLPETKDEIATGAWADDGIVQQATRAIKREVPGLLLMGDVCLCEYMSHGHCGIVETDVLGREVTATLHELESQGKKAVAVKTGVQPAAAIVAIDTESYEILNDASLDLLAKTAVSQAKAGMDIIAPSDMMDGRVAAIRTALDAAGYENIPILSYAAKFASGFYGPFREAADSAPHFGDRRSYQMDPANLREAMREIELDLEEGADMIMVKPAHAVPRRDPRSARAIRCAAGCLPGQRRIRHDQSCSDQRLDRLRTRDAGVTHLYPACRRLDCADLLCQGSGSSGLN